MVVEYRHGMRRIAVRLERYKPGSMRGLSMWVELAVGKWKQFPAKALPQSQSNAIGWEPNRRKIHAF
jgi:hypothetical protein